MFVVFLALCFLVGVIPSLELSKDILLSVSICFSDSGMISITDSARKKRPCSESAVDTSNCIWNGKLAWLHYHSLLNDLITAELELLRHSLG